MTRSRTLTDQQIAEITTRYAAGGITQYELADEYGVSQSTIRYWAVPGAREKISETIRRTTDPDRKRENLRKWRAENRERYLASRRAWWAANREREIQRQRDKRAALDDARRAAVSESHRRWFEKNPGAGSEHRSIRRARERAASVERVYRAKVWQRDGGICGLCGEAADPADWHLDHVVPIARGGEHSYANVQVAHPGCNRKKWANAA